MYNTGYIRVT